MKTLRLYVAVVVREAVRTAWLTVSVLGVIGGATLVGIAKDLADADARVIAVGVGAALIVFTIIGGYRAWKAELKSAEDFGDEVDDLQVRLQSAAPTLIGGAGGDGGSGGIGDLIINGNAGGGGSVAYGEGAVAYGGEGGKSPVSAFEMLARVARHGLWP